MTNISQICSSKAYLNCLFQLYHKRP